MFNPDYLAFEETKLDIKDCKFVNADVNNSVCAKLPPITYTVRDTGALHIELVIPERHENHVPLYDENGGVNDILFPTNPDGTRAYAFPTIVYVQGSGWLKQNLGFRIPMLSRFVMQGFAMAFVEYRSAEVAPFPAQVQDLKTAVHFLKKHAAEYNLDVNKMVLWGDSSGAHTAVLAAVTENMPEFEIPDDTGCDCRVKGVVDFYGPTAVEKFNIPMAKTLLGVDDLESNPELVAKANPAYYIEKGKDYPPFLIMHGTKDRLVSQEQSKLLYDKMLDCGVNATFYSVRGGDHGRAEFWCDAVCDIVKDFIDGCIS